MSTDQDDYAPGSTVVIDGAGFSADCDVLVHVSRPDGVVETVAGSTGLDGTLRVEYLLPPPPGVMGEYRVDVVGAWDEVLASVLFTDAIAGPNSSFNANTSSGQATLTLPKPTNTVQGDFLIAQVSVGGFSSTSGGTDTVEKICPPTGWTSVEKTVIGSDVVVETFRKFAGASEPVAPDGYVFRLRSNCATTSVSDERARRASGGMLRYTGVDTTTPVEAKSEVSGISSTPTALSVTASAGSRVIAIFGIKAAGAATTPAAPPASNSVTPPSGMTERYEVTNPDGSGPLSEAADLVVTAQTAGATGNKQANTGSINREWVAQLISLKEAAATDATAPANAAISIDDGAAWTRDAAGVVSLDLSGTDAVGVTRYRLAETQTGLGSATDVAVSPAATNFSKQNVAFTLSGAQGSGKAVWLRLCDAVGNCADAHDVIGWDKTAPTVSITKNATGAWHNGDVVITATPADSGGSGVDAATLACKDGAANLPLDAANKATISGEGTHAITCTVSDVAGNTGNGAETVKIDLTAPVTSDNVPTGWQTQDVTVTLSVVETGSGVDKTYVAVFSGATVPTTGFAEYDATAKPTLKNGEKVAYYSVDVAGNREATRTSTAALVDYPPLLSLSSSSVSGQYTDAVALSASATDPDNGTLTYSATGLPNGLAIDSATGVVGGTINAPAGPYPAKISVSDGRNTVGEPVTVTVNKENASVTYTGQTVAATGTNIALEGLVHDSAVAGYAGTLESPATIGDILKVGQVRFSISSYASCGAVGGTSVDANVLGTVTAGVGRATGQYAAGNTEQTICVAAQTLLNAWYASPVSEGTPIAIYLNSGKFVTGGGWIADPASRNGKGNFGFNARFNKTGKPMGQMVYVTRGTYTGTPAGGVYAGQQFENLPVVYMIKSNALESLVFTGASYPMTGALSGKSSIQVNRADTGETIDGEGGVFFEAKVVDTNQNDARTDSFSLRVGGTKPWSNRTLPATNLGGGNIVIRK